MRRVLVVDDYGPGAEAVSASLTEAGYEVRFVLDGLAALETVRSWIPQIALLDINMPEMDGYAVARRLRAEDLTRQTIIVAFTALDEPTTRRSGVGAGFDAYCQKGAAPGPLLRLLETLAH
ncbi:response regulator [Paraburkholderia nodosa]|uniref:response regulator n=1 Tax=Paraburkholderia sp. BR10882 TaxID=3236991 RepID=UPI000841F2E7